MAVTQPLVGGFVLPTKPNPTVTTASTVVDPRPVRAGVSWPFSVLIYLFLSVFTFMFCYIINAV